MTGKRFHYRIDEVGIYYYVCDNTKKGDDRIILEFDTKYDAMEVCELLNELHEENQALHKTIEELDNCQKGQSHRINDLYLEHKQLKDLITHLGYTIKYDGYRHISLELKR